MSIVLVSEIRELVSEIQFIDNTYLSFSILVGVGFGLYILKKATLLVLLVAAFGLHNRIFSLFWAASFLLVISVYWSASFRVLKNESIKVGPWGGSGGGPWTFIPNGRITQLNVRSGSIVDAVCFHFRDRWGFTQQSGNFGGSGGGYRQIHFGKDEEIINISGSVGVFEGHTVITSMIFVTNMNAYGRFGTRMGTDFTLPVTKGKIIGFYGRHGIYLDSLGVVLVAPEDQERN